MKLTVEDMLRSMNGGELPKPITQTTPPPLLYSVPQEPFMFRSGCSLSIQASAGHYCTPRQNDALNYTTVEIGIRCHTVEQRPPQLDYEFPDDFRPTSEDCVDDYVSVATWVPAHLALAALQWCLHFWGPLEDEGGGTLPPLSFGLDREACRLTLDE